MDLIDLERAKKLLKSAESLLEKEDMSGAGGLAYQAFESAVMAVTKSAEKKDYPDHEKRQKKAEELLKVSQEVAKKLWIVRNVDFYGNEKIGEEEREITKEEIEHSIKEVQKIMKVIEQHYTQ